MSNPNTVTVYDPQGEAFEMSPANARDLVTHAGWSKTKPTVIVKEVPAAAEPAACEVPAETETESTTEAEGANEAPAEEAAAEETVEDAPAADEPFTSVEQFADLTTREALVEYLGKHFKDFTPHHKSGRDKLVEKAIELATA